MSIYDCKKWWGKYRWKNGQKGELGRNENGENLVEVCSKKGFFLENTYFEHKMITDTHGEDGSILNEQKGQIHYTDKYNTEERFSQRYVGEIT